MAKLIIASRLGFILALGGFAALAHTAMAANQTTPDLDISCLQSPAKLDDAKLQSFMVNPGVLLTENASGGLPLSNRVRELAGSSSHAFAKIMELAKTASESQKAAIAAGLARVVYACGNVGSEMASNYGAEIQSAVAGLGDPAFASAFLQASSDIKTASVAPGSSGFSIGGGQTNDDTTGQFGARNNYQSEGDGPLDVTSANYTIGRTTPYIDDSKTTSQSGSNK